MALISTFLQGGEEKSDRLEKLEQQVTELKTDVNVKVKRVEKGIDALMAQMKKNEERDRHKSLQEEQRLLVQPKGPTPLLFDFIESAKDEPSMGSNEGTEAEVDPDVVQYGLN